MLYDFIKIKFIDELLIYTLFLYAFYGITCKQFKAARGLIVFIGVAAFYVCYSFIIESNVPQAILKDLIIQGKPYIAFFSIVIINPVINLEGKTQINRLTLLIGILLGVIAVFQLLGFGLLYIIFQHPSRFSTTVTLTAILYLCSSKLSTKTVVYSILLLSVGLIAQRAKFYGFFVSFVLMMVVDRFSLMTRLSFKSKFLVAIGCISIVLIVAYQKIDFYFIQGFKELVNYNPEGDYNMHMLARPAMYLVVPSILIDYFPFGCGLGSFATYASEVYYSPIYEMYGIGDVYGLSQEKPCFINDAYLPSLAQFGVVGIIFFVLFWSHIVKLLYNNRFSKVYRQEVIIATLLIFFLTIEVLTGSTYTQNRGAFVMMLLGLVYTSINVKIRR